MAYRSDMLAALRRAALVGLLIAPGCAIENPDHVQDSTGAETGWGCASGGCSTIRETFSRLPPECGDGDAELLVGAGALALLCAVSIDAEGEDVVHPLTCRPLVCADGLDCPQWAGRNYVCIQGLCQVDATAGWHLDRVDLIALCLHDLPRHASCDEAETDPVVIERLAAVDMVCDEVSCEAIPDGCLAP